jgi:hypothetical protein
MIYLAAASNCTTEPDTLSVNEPTGAGAIVELNYPEQIH